MFPDLCLTASPYLGIHLLAFPTGRAVPHLMNTTVLAPKARNTLKQSFPILLIGLIVVGLV